MESAAEMTKTRHVLKNASSRSAKTAIPPRPVPLTRMVVEITHTLSPSGAVLQAPSPTVSDLTTNSYPCQLISCMPYSPPITACPIALPYFIVNPLLFPLLCSKLKSPSPSKKGAAWKASRWRMERMPPRRVWNAIVQLASLASKTALDFLGMKRGPTK